MSETESEISLSMAIMLDKQSIVGLISISPRVKVSLDVVEFTASTTTQPNALYNICM